MSTTQEDSEGTGRVTRGSLRRMASNESLNDLESRVDTPTLSLRASKKLQTISEDSLTPSRKARATESPLRRTRKGSEEPVGSPFRRTTRGMSAEKEISASPLPTRVSRRSTLADSEDEAPTVITTPAVPKSARKNRKSVVASPSVGKINEESEDEKEQENGKQTEEAMNTTDELELRNRSITKSPSVGLSPNKSLNQSSNGHVDENGSVGETELSEENTSTMSLNQSRVENNETAWTISENDMMKAEKTPKNKSRKSLQPTSALYEEVAKELSKSCSKATKKSKFEPSSPAMQLNASKSNGHNVTDQGLLSPKGTPVRGRPSIHSGGTPRLEKVVSELMEDFVDESDVEKASPQKAGKTPKKTPSKGTPKSTNGNGTILDRMDMLISEEYLEDALNSSDNQGIDMDITSPIQASGSAKRKTKSPKHDKLSRTWSQPEIEIEASKAEDLKQRRSLKTYIDETGMIAQSRRKSEVSHCEETSKTLTPTKVSWAQSIQGGSTKSIDKLIPASPQVIKSSKSPTNVRKSISSDESEDEIVKNSFVDDEAEVGSDSMSESERNYLQMNEVVEDGESIGSQDSNELGSEEEDSADESFIDQDEDLSDSYSMDSGENEIEEHKKTPKRRSRIIAPSSSEDEEPSVAGKTLNVSQKSVKSPKSQQNGKPAESDDDEADAAVSPQKKSKTPLKSPKSRKSVVSELEAEEPTEKTTSKTPQKSPKTRKSSSNIELQQAEEPEVVTEKLNKKRKRESHIDANESVVVKAKRSKMTEDIGNESEAMHMENMTGVADLFEESESEPEEAIEKVKPKKSKKPTEFTDVFAVLNKCKEILDPLNAEKKANLTLKREKKAAKLAKKKLDHDAQKAAAAALGLDVSSESNKENAKKKKKNKAKKQKLIGDKPEGKEDIGTSVLKAQQKLELQRQRKAEKKLAKQQRQQEEAAKENNQQGDENEASTSKLEKKPKQISAGDLKVVQSEPIIWKQAKSSEISKMSKASVVAQEVPVKEKKKKRAEVVEEPQTVEIEKKKKKKRELEPETVETVAPIKQKKKKREEIVEEAVEVPEKKKSKKRKVTEDEAMLAEAPKPKKLNVLKQIEDPQQFNGQREELKKPREEEFSIALPSHKLKKLIPQDVAVEKKPKKKQHQRQVIPEPRRSLPKPVFTTAGVFIEQPVTPFKFTTTQYVPIKAAASSTKFGVIAFEGKKKKNPAGQPPMDFKTQAIMRNKKNRDGTMKNMRGLVTGQRTF